LLAVRCLTQRNAETINKAINEVCSGMLDMKPLIGNKRRTSG
jgi:hypothetical protein